MDYVIVMNFEIFRNEKYKQTTKKLELLQKNVQQSLSSKKPLKIFSYLSQVYDSIIDNHLSIIIYLHHKGYLEHILKIFQGSALSKSKQFISQLEILQSCANKCFLMHYQVYQQVIDFMKEENPYNFKKQFNTHLKENNANYPYFCNLLIKFFQLKKRKKEQHYIDMINHFISSELSRKNIESCFEQIIYTWLKIQLQKQMSQYHQASNNVVRTLCCRLHFRQNQQIHNEQCNELNLEIREFIKKGTLVDYDYLKKIVIGRLNHQYPGSIYYGISQNKIKGISMKPDDIQEFLRDFFQKVAEKIGPNEYYPLDDEEQKEQRQIKLKQAFKYFSIQNHQKQYEINSFITIQFVELYNYNTLLLHRSQTGKIVYIIKILIKNGDPGQLYHHINEFESPQSYILNKNGLPVRLSHSQFFQNLRSRLMKKSDGKFDNIPKKKRHSRCRYNQLAS